MQPTEYEATVAVDAAARKAHESRPGNPEVAWDDLDSMHKNVWRNYVLPLVWAALEALPDRRATAWDEGAVAGLELTPHALRNPYREGDV